MTIGQSISEIMMKHHYMIDKILKSFTSELKDDKAVNANIFNRFRWELEKHFFLEEKAIFQMKYSFCKDTQQMCARLKLEHDQMIEQLDEIDTVIKLNKSLDFSQLKEMIIEHKKFENQEFYPRLDRELSDDRKELIIERISNPL
jgi:hypothetical protein